MTKGLYNLDLNERKPKGFSTLESELWRSRGFSTLILTEGKQGAFNFITGAVATKGLSNLDLSCGDQKAFNLNLTKGNQGVF